MQTDWIEADGILLRYEFTPAAGRGAPIILVHEMGGMLESWDAIVPALSRHAPVLRYDQRGAGLSEKPPGPTPIKTHVDDLARLLDALDVTEPAVVVGCAVGAAISIAFAAAHPDRVRALVLLSPATGIEPERRPATEERAATVERLGIRAAGGERPERQGEPLRSRYDLLTLANAPASLGATMRMLAHLDLGRQLAAIACPTLVAGGRRDTYRPPDHVLSAVAERIAGARFVALDTGHVMAVETPELTARTIGDFLKTLDA